MQMEFTSSHTNYNLEREVLSMYEFPTSASVLEVTFNELHDVLSQMIEPSIITTQRISDTTESSNFLVILYIYIYAANWW
jgi:hypothetical protein